MSIFSRIIAGEISSSKVYEDHLCIAIFDIQPVAQGHTLVVPKQEIPRFQDLPVELMHHCMNICQRISKSMIKNIPCDYVQLRIMGEEVPHCHIHLIPMMLHPRKDQSKRPAVRYEDGEIEEIVKKISTGI